MGETWKETIETNVYGKHGNPDPGFKNKTSISFNYKKKLAKDVMNELLDGLTDTSTPLNQGGKARVSEVMNAIVS